MRILDVTNSMKHD
jgi:hypothetical protein